MTDKTKQVAYPKVAIRKAVREALRSLPKPSATFESASKITDEIRPLIQAYAEQRIKDSFTAARNDFSQKSVVEKIADIRSRLEDVAREVYCDDEYATQEEERLRQIINEFVQNVQETLRDIDTLCRLADDMANKSLFPKAKMEMDEDEEEDDDDDDDESEHQPSKKASTPSQNLKGWRGLGSAVDDEIDEDEEESTSIKADFERKGADDDFEKLCSDHDAIMKQEEDDIRRAAQFIKVFGQDLLLHIAKAYALYHSSTFKDIGDRYVSALKNMRKSGPEAAALMEHFRI